MWKLFLQFAVLRTMLRSVGWLVLLAPIAFILKIVGIPLLIILAVIGLPLLLVLLFLGLPIIVVLVFGSMLMAVLGAVVAVGAPILKVLLPIVLVVWAVGWLWRRGRGDSPASDGPLTGDIRGPGPATP